MKTQGRAQAWSLGMSYGGTKLLPVKDMDGSFCPETISFPGCPDNSLFECPFLNIYLYLMVPPGVKTLRGRQLHFVHVGYLQCYTQDTQHQ